MAVNLSSPNRLASRRRGVALLLVLAMIILIVPVAVGFTQRAVIASLEQRLSAQEEIAGSIRAQLESGPLQTWLAGVSSSSGRRKSSSTQSTPGSPSRLSASAAVSASMKAGGGSRRASARRQISRSTVSSSTIRMPSERSTSRRRAAVADTPGGSSRPVQPTGATSLSVQYASIVRMASTNLR